MGSVEPRRIAAVAALFASSFLAAPWAVYQWMELVIALDGGEVACAAGPTFDCLAVWFHPAAKSVHRLSGLPVAGWGLVWALTAFVAAARLALSPSASAALSVHLVGAVGAVSSVLLFALSAASGTFCPTCLATYGLVGVYVAGAFAGWPVRRAPWVPAITPLALAVVGGWAGLLVPGLNTAVEPSSGLETLREPKPAPTTAGNPPQDELSRFIASLPPRGKAALADTVAGLRGPIRNQGVVARRRIGPDQAPVLLTDFSDLRCPHCQRLTAALAELRGRFGDQFAEDPRYFPLSADCNPEVPPSLVDPTGVRCLAPKVLLCFEDRPEYPELRERFFAEENLDRDRMAHWLAEVLNEKPEAIDSCAESAEVAEKLAADIAYAMRYDLKGTPLLLWNGREVQGHPQLLFALLLANGDPDHPAFRALPSPTR